MQRRLDEAASLLTEFEAACRRCHGADSIPYAEYLVDIAQISPRLTPAEREALYRRAADTFGAAGAGRTLASLAARLNLGPLAAERGDFAEAERELQAVLDDADELPAPSRDWTRANARCRLGEVKIARGEFALAESLLTEGFKGLVESRAPNLSARANAARSLQRLYESWDAAEGTTERAERAAEWRDRAAEIEARR